MSNIYKNVTELIGRTPLVEVEKIEKRFKLQARLLVKLDGYNPASRQRETESSSRAQQLSSQHQEIQGSDLLQLVHLKDTESFL